MKQKTPKKQKTKNKKKKKKKKENEIENSVIPPNIGINQDRSETDLH